MTQSPNLLLLGHRGARASGAVPENTLGSFELCIEQGCDGFEFDVRRSGDGVAVICHDPVIRGLRIEKASARQLALPILEEVLGRFSAKAFLDIELKIAGLAEPLIGAIREHPPCRGYVVSSFLPEALTELHHLDANIPLGFLYNRHSQLPPPAVPIAWMIPQLKLVDRKLIDEVHEAGQKVMAWTVNRPADMQQLAEWGVDGIISDETELLMREFR